MAEHTRKYYTCDICGIEMAEPYSGGEMGTYTLRTTSDYAVSGDAWAWKDMCRECNSYLGRVISDLEVTSKQMREARSKA